MNSESWEGPNCCIEFLISVLPVSTISNHGSQIILIGKYLFRLPLLCSDKDVLIIKAILLFGKQVKLEVNQELRLFLTSPR